MLCHDETVAGQPLEEEEAPRDPTDDDILAHSAVFNQHVEHLTLFTGGRLSATSLQALLDSSHHLSSLCCQHKHFQ